MDAARGVIVNLTSAGLRRRLDTLPTAKLWDIAGALDIDPERLPYATDRMTPESPALRRRLRGAILSELHNEGKKSAWAG